MKRKLLTTFLTVFISSTFGWAQDIPLFTQKLTNSFLYNPSVAGNALGSLTLSHRQYWSGVQDSPNTNFISLHVPFAYHKLGFGINFYQDKIGASQTLFTSAAFAYHIRFTDDNSLSMGVSAEYDNFKLNATRIDVTDLDDELLSGQAPVSQLDFAFGLSYQSKYFNVGGSVNRIRDFILQTDSTETNQFPAYYSAFLNLKIPVAGDRDLIEPVVTYRSLAPGSNQIDAGIYYTYKNFATLGGGYRTGGIMNLTAAVRVHKNILVGYSREMFSENFQRNIGATNEFTLRIDFKDHNYYSKSKNARQISTEALALRRKTLVSYKGKGSTMQKSQRYKKKLKKKYIHSPNYRINASKKLMTKKVKKNYNRKPSSHKRKRSKRKK